MKKRTLAIFLGLLLVFCLSSCACQHEWKETTCTEPKTCTKCGDRGRGPGTQVDSNLHKSEGVQPLRSRKRESTGS